MVRPGCPADFANAIMRNLISAIEGIARDNKLSSAHVTFPTEGEWRRLGEAGWLQRTGQQFHWENRGYGSFDDFLAALASRKRKAIRKERREVVDRGVIIRPLTGADLKPEHWDAFYGFYITTSEHKWGHAYLSREFFHRIGETMADRIVLMFAEDGGRPIAGALNLMGGGVLYGRNWGALGEYKFLHFEACYYQAIEFAIRHGLARVEAGAQGPHKIQRGYLPSPTYSAHWIADPRFREAVAHFLERERAHLEHEMTELSDYSPFRKGISADEPA
jgi:hypothetical protein